MEVKRGEVKKEKSQTQQRRNHPPQTHRNRHRIRITLISSPHIHLIDHTPLIAQPHHFHPYSPYQDHHQDHYHKHHQSNHSYSINLTLIVLTKHHYRKHCQPRHLNHYNPYQDHHRKHHQPSHLHPYNPNQDHHHKHCQPHLSHRYNPCQKLDLLSIFLKFLILFSKI